MCTQPAGIAGIFLGLGFLSASTPLAALESVQEKWWEAEKVWRKEKWRGTKKQKGANEVREGRERERERGKTETCTTICHT